MRGNSKKGFTIIEVALVIGISGLAVAAFMASIGGRISAQRYNDATKSYVDFLQRVYSEVINVQNSRSGEIGDVSKYCTLSSQKGVISGDGAAADYDNEFPGRSDCSVYGKLVTFGEQNKDTIYTYDVIGRAIDLNEAIGGSGSIASELAYVYADTLTLKKNSSGSCKLAAAGETSIYNPEWDTRIEDTSHNLMKASLLIVRSPKTGAVKSLYMPQVMEIQQAMEDHADESCGNTNVQSNNIQLKSLLESGSFSQTDVDFCVSNNGFFVSKRNDVRLKGDGHNATAVEFVETDLSPAEGGNRC